MTQDPWAEAQASMSGTATPAAAQPGQSQVAPPPSTPGSQLFSSGAVAPSLFNKTHFVGTKRGGIITKAPYDRQRIDFNLKKPLFWAAGGGKPVVEHADPATGQPNRPVMDTFLELSTDYTMNAAEAGAVGRETPFEGGERVFVAGGFDLKELRSAMERAVKAGVKLGCEEDFVGKRLDVTRTAQKQNQGGNPSWIIHIDITNA